MEKRGPWKVIKSILKYKNPWISVREDQVVNTNNKEGIFGVVDMKSGVSILAVDEKNDAYLVEEFRYAINQKSIEVPNGAIDPGETPLEAAKRELREESGIIAEEWMELGLVNPFTTVVHSPSYQFLARKLKFVEKEQEENEFIRNVKIPFYEAFEKVMRGEITHSPSCVAILKSNKFIK